MTLRTVVLVAMLGLTAGCAKTPPPPAAPSLPADPTAMSPQQASRLDCAPLPVSQGQNRMTLRGSDLGLDWRKIPEDDEERQSLGEGSAVALLYTRTQLRVYVNVMTVKQVQKDFEAMFATMLVEPRFEVGQPQQITRGCSRIIYFAVRSKAGGSVGRFLYSVAISSRHPGVAFYVRAFWPRQERQLSEWNQEEAIRFAAGLYLMPK